MLVVYYSMQHMECFIKHEDHYRARVNFHCGFEKINVISEKLTVSQKDLFSKTCFGHFLNIKSYANQDKLVHHVLLREVNQPNLNEM